MEICQMVSRTSVYVVVLLLISVKIWPASCIKGDDLDPTIPSIDEVVHYGGVGIATYCLDCLIALNCPAECRPHCGPTCWGHPAGAQRSRVCNWCREEWRERQHLPECRECDPPY
ncbi:hypothetical protein CSUI_002804 [Cystoisospora suis]|uniref:Transmembrane protein n=1 Tax=Cystoisospora suis TaxID=483139 RepID=A0A2C6L3B4_9APIC|nr:hypothetical protein CSUI_002804 [Cystoisospora suis]